jgi:hypothetical protein
MNTEQLDHRSGKDDVDYYIRTFSGQKLYWSKLEDHTYSIVDIAHALALRVRWSGHVRYFYSIAQHSVLVSYLVEPEYQLAALLHDASEAYIADIPSPLKWYMAQQGNSLLKDLEEKIDCAIAYQFNFQFPRHPSIKQADITLLATENRDLMPEGEERLRMQEPMAEHICAWDWRRAETLFLQRYNQIMGNKYGKGHYIGLDRVQQHAR